MRVRLIGIRESYNPTEEETAVLMRSDRDHPRINPMSEGLSGKHVLIADFRVVGNPDYEGFTMEMGNLSPSQIGDEFEVQLHPVRNEK